MMSSTHLKCPNCLQSSVRKVEGQRAVCRVCSENQRQVYQFCWACQREWPKTEPLGTTCTLPNCALRAALLSGKEIENKRSSVFDCPFFRACPNCKALLTHTGVGCPNIVCPDCHTDFCFRCLRRNCYGTLARGCILVDNSETLRALQ